MRISKHRGRIVASGLVAIFTMVAVIGLASDCNAQFLQRRFARGAGVHQGELPTAGRKLRQPVFQRAYPSRTTNTPADSRNHDSQDWRYEQSNEPFPKYIGGFHSSYYSNMGIPGGTAGFRTNGIYWPPW